MLMWVPNYWKKNVYCVSGSMYRDPRRLQDPSLYLFYGWKHGLCVTKCHLCFSFRNVIKATWFCSCDRDILSHTRGEGDTRTQGIRTLAEKLPEYFYSCSPHFSQRAIAWVGVKLELFLIGCFCFVIQWSQHSFTVLSGQANFEMYWYSYIGLNF